MLPRLDAVPWSVAPSAAVWWQAGRRPAPRRRRDVIVIGPGLPGTLAEAAGIAAGYRDPVVLTTGAATAQRVLAALDGASTAHLAAHGVFRGDSPLFSSVHLDDGPLTVYEFGRLRRAPHRMILSSCESGVAAPVAGDELLGMISVLVPLGTTSLLASMVPVNDAATVPVMSEFHAGLRGGSGFGEAMRRARSRMSGDPVAAATAAAFVVLGR
jgi:CHAT domain-containing protein